MPKIIPISGIIHNYEMENESNVTPDSLRKSLQKANGEDVLITINSPGGLVFPGLEMFSLIRNYSGNVETRIVSLAASMGSVLALAGNKISAENTALYFIHNAQGMGYGDYRDLAAESDWLKDISNLIANLYAEYTNLTFDEAVDFMDDDSHFLGADLELLGFEIVQTGNEPNAATSRVNAKMKMKEVAAKITAEEQKEDMEKAVAYVNMKKTKKKGPGMNIETVTESLGPQKISNNPAAAGENTREVIMTLSEFLKAHPAAQAEFDQAKADAKKAGEDAVNKRIEAAEKYIANTEYPESIREVAAKVMKGEVDEISLTATVSAYDATQEALKSGNAQAETNAQGDIGSGDAPEVDETGIIKTDADHNAAIDRVKAMRG